MAAVLLAAFGMAVAAPAAVAAGSPFVSRAGTKLVLEGKPYRFTGLNIYNANSTGNCWFAMASGPALQSSLEAIGPGKNAFPAFVGRSTRGAASR